MKAKSIAECSNGSILQYFSAFIKLPFVIKIFVLPIWSDRLRQVLLYIVIRSRMSKIIHLNVWIFTTSRNTDQFKLCLRRMLQFIAEAAY